MTLDPLKPGSFGKESVADSDGIGGRVIVVGVTKDHAEVWSLDERQRGPLAVVVRHDSLDRHPHVRTGQFRHGHDADEGFDGFFADLATLIQGANEVMIAGHGAGRSNMMEAFADYLSRKRSDVFRKVSEMRHVDLPHTTGRQLAALGRKWKSEQRVSGQAVRDD